MTSLTKNSRRCVLRRERSGFFKNYLKCHMFHFACEY